MVKSKQVLIYGAAFSLMISMVRSAWTHGNERGTAKATIGNATVSIDYGRPTLKGRNMLQKIQPGHVWRIGADFPTIIQSDMDLDFGGTRVPRGKHILLARLVEPGKWTLIISNKPAQQYDPTAKIAEVPMVLRETTDPAEELLIQLSDKGGQGVIEIAWGTSRLLASFAPAR